LFTLPVLAKNTILVIGDSLSAGYGIEPNTGWVALMKTRLQDRKMDYNVFNVSVSGVTTNWGLQHLPLELARYHPQITIIELGANDGLQGLPPALMKKNLLQLIDMAKSANSKVMVLGLRLPPNYGQAYLDQFQQVFQEIAGEPGVVTVPLFLNNVDTNKSMMQSDGIHPNESGQPLILNNVWDELETLIQS
jgi:acyl-CoA thioesterase-1